MIKPTAMKSVVWVGVYKGRKAHLGWVLPKFAAPNGSTSLDPLQSAIIAGKRHDYYPGDFYRASLTLTPLKDKKGNFIVRRNRRRKKAKR